GEHVELAGHLSVHDQDLALADDVLERASLPRELAIEAAERLLSGRIDEQSADKIGELVAGRALDRPVLAQVLMARENLLDHQIEWPRGPLAQADAIALGIEQTVDMIDAESVERPAADLFEHEAVSEVEQFRLLHAQAGEFVDVEKT